MPRVSTAPLSILARKRAGIAIRPLPSTVWRYSPRNISDYPPQLEEVSHGAPLCPTLPHIAKYRAPQWGTKALYPRVLSAWVDKAWTTVRVMHTAHGEAQRSRLTSLAARFTSAYNGLRTGVRHRVAFSPRRLHEWTASEQMERADSRSRRPRATSPHK